MPPMKKRLITAFVGFLAFFAVALATPATSYEPTDYIAAPQQQVASVIFQTPTPTPRHRVVDTRQLQCLTEAVYYEAGNQPDKGKEAVAHVVLNRLKTGQFGSTVCKVVYERSTKGCAFTWVCHGTRAKINQDVLSNVKRIAQVVYSSEQPDFTHGALYFHTLKAKPYWRKFVEKTLVLGDHVFYRKRPATNV